jgi:hypothetical protein
MKALACLAVLGLAIAGCSFHSDTVVEKPTPVARAAYANADANGATTLYLSAE